MDDKVASVSAFDVYCDIMADEAIVTVESCGDIDVSTVMDVVGVFSELTNATVVSIVVSCCNGEREVDISSVEIETSLEVLVSIVLENRLLV